jgi:hypothetical protein
MTIASRRRSATSGDFASEFLRDFLALHNRSAGAAQIDPVSERLDELGISDVDPQNLLATRHSAVKEHF